MACDSLGNLPSIEEDQLDLALKYHKLLGERWSDPAERLRFFIQVMQEEEDRRKARVKKGKQKAENLAEGAFRKLTKALNCLRDLEIYENVKVRVQKRSYVREYILSFHLLASKRKQSTEHIAVRVKTSVSAEGEATVQYYAHRRNSGGGRPDDKSIQDKNLDVVVNRMLWWLAHMAKHFIEEAKIEKQQHEEKAKDYTYKDNVAKVVNPELQVVQPQIKIKVQPSVPMPAWTWEDEKEAKVCYLN